MLLGVLLSLAFGGAGQTAVVRAGSKRARPPRSSVLRAVDVLDGGGVLERDGDRVSGGGSGKVLLGVGKSGVQ